MEAIIPLLSFYVDCPKPFSDMIYCILMTLSSIYDENPEPVSHFFEETTVNGITSYSIIPEFTLLLSFFQVWLFDTMIHI